MEQLFFDFDGTIADSEVGIVNSIKYFVKQMGLRPLTDAEYRTFIGPALTSSLKRYYPEIDETTITQAINTYQDYYLKEGIYQLDLYPGIKQALTDIRNQGYRVNIASAKPEQMINQIVKHFDLGDYFDGEFGATMDERVRSTKTEVLAYALDETKAVPADSLMIGDRDTDMLGGKNNGVKTLGVLYGFGDRAELQAADANYIIDRPNELLTGITKVMAN